MDRNAHYRALIRQLLQEMTDNAPASSTLQTELVFDEERGHYHYGEVGWDGDQRIDSVLVLKLKLRRYWKYHFSELYLANDLVAASLWLLP